MDTKTDESFRTCTRSHVNTGARVQENMAFRNKLNSRDPAKRRSALRGAAGCSYTLSACKTLRFPSFSLCSSSHRPPLFHSLPHQRRFGALPRDAPRKLRSAPVLHRKPREKLRPTPLANRSSFFPHLPAARLPPPATSFAVSVTLPTWGTPSRRPPKSTAHPVVPTLRRLRAISSPKPGPSRSFLAATWSMEKTCMPQVMRILAQSSVRTCLYAQAVLWMTGRTNRPCCLRRASSSRAFFRVARPL